MNWKTLFAWVVLLLANGHLLAAQTKTAVEVVADLLELFPSAQITNCSSWEVRRPSVAGGVKQNAIFEHPVTPERPARAEFQLHLPDASPGDLLLFAFDIAIADGVKLTPRDDGVRFTVEVDGKKVFTRETRETRWQSHALDLTPLAGRRVPLALLTDPITNSSYDWAVWGSPRVLRFRGTGGVKADSPGKISSQLSSGVFAVKPAAEVKVRLKPAGGGSAVEWTAPAQAWLAKDFDFPAATGVELEWEPKDAIPAANLLVAAYPARLELLTVSATRAVVFAGETVPVRVELKNDGRGKLEAGEATLKLRAGEESVASQTLPAIAPGETWRGEWNWKAPAEPAALTLHAQLIAPQPLAEKRTVVEVFAPVLPGDTWSIQNEQIKVQFVPQAGTFAFARVFARQADDWTPVAVWRPLFQIVAETKAGAQTLEIRPHTARQTADGRTMEFSETIRDADGVAWETRLRVALDSNQPMARVHYEWKAAGAREVKALLGPNLYVGDGTTGEAKTWGLFPGLEYLYGAERSSNPRDFAPNLADRRTPHPHKITVPLMAITIGPDSQAPPEKAARFFAPDSLKDRSSAEAAQLKAQSSKLNSDFTVALTWNPHQKWDGEHAFPATRFASPNFDEGMSNHRLGLFLPSAPDFVPENSDRAAKPYPLPAGKTLTLDANLIVAPGPVTVALREWLRDTGGLPKPSAWPRSFQEELDICRAGFLKTVWSEADEKWRHCIGWAAQHAPGFAALLWLDAQIAAKPAARKASRERVELAATNMLRAGGAGVFASQSGCHIMQWEFPFLYGHLPEAMTAIDGQVRHLIQSQQPDGGWLYQPGNTEQADLGQAGDSVLGTCANRASTLLRHARITGDAASLAAGEKALRFMEHFRLPRGGQTWECPMYEPDILAAAYAIRAYHDAWRVTGNARWLHNAVYWAETGVPFIYLWSLPDKPMMLGATIPVFGSTFYTHTWLAVPVQWCGLVYSYHVFHLAEDLARTPLPKTDSPLPLALDFSAADWRRVVEHITVSGAHQQFADGEKIGAYPDSIAKFETRNPAFLNPEDLLVNVLALHGYDPDVKTARTKSVGGDIVVSSGARVQNLQTTATGVRFELRALPGEPSHTLVVGLKPREVLLNGNPLTQSATPVRREAGWWWDEKQQRSFLTVPQAKPVAEVAIVRE